MLFRISRVAGQAGLRISDLRTKTTEFFNLFNLFSFSEVHGYRIRIYRMNAKIIIFINYKVDSAFFS